MDKLTLAHDWFISSINNGKHVTIEQAWAYADAMQAEADKRNKAEAEQKRKEIREMLNAPNTFVEREGQHFDDVYQCEVDWRVAPCWAKEWVMRNGTAKWECGAHADSWEDAPSFGFTGSHIVERPHGF